MKPSVLKLISVIGLACWGSVALPLSPCQAQSAQSAQSAQPVVVQLSRAEWGLLSHSETFGTTWEPREEGRPDRRRGAGSR